MRWIRRCLNRFACWRQMSKLDAEMREEMRQHLELRFQANLQAGLAAEEARYAALRQFGSVTSMQQICREQRGFIGLEHWLLDLRHSLRRLRGSPVFVLVVISILALGIGANTAIYSLLEQVLLRSLPVKNPDALTLVITEGKEIGSSWGMHRISYPMFKDLREMNEVFEGMMCRRLETAHLSGPGGAERIEVELVSSDYFSVLGLQPALGRLFGIEDETLPGANPVVVLSHDFWRGRFGADSNILGRVLHLNNYPMTVVGVAAKGFQGIGTDSRPRLFVPVTMKRQVTPSWDDLENRRSQWVNAFGRLKPGLTRQQAQTALQPLYSQIIHGEAQGPGFETVTAEDREAFLRSRVALLPGGRGFSFMPGALRLPLWCLMAAAIMVLLIACANVANLLLAWTASRRKEISVCLALGISRGRLIGQGLMESLLLAGAGGGAALLVAYWTTRLILGSLPSEQWRLALSPELNGKLLMFTLWLSVLTALLCGLWPTWRMSRIELHSALKEPSSLEAGRGGAFARKVLLVGQVGLSFALLIGAGLFIRSLAALRQQDPGFQTARLIRFKLDPMLNDYHGEGARQLFHQLRQRLLSFTEVESVALARLPLLENNCWINGITVEGVSPGEYQRASAEINAVSADYLRTLGLAMVQGRDFEEADDQPGARPVALVNQAFARQFFADRSPVGAFLGLGSARPDREVIGVFRDSKYAALRRPVEPQVLILSPGSWAQDMIVYARMRSSSPAMLGIIREQVRMLDARLPVYDLKAMEDQLEDSVGIERLLAVLCGLFAALATVVALVGLYGVMAGAVAQRVQEIGIRMALGAQRRNIFCLVLRQGVTLAGAGLAVGGGLGWGLSRWAASLLYGISSTDPATYLSVLLLWSAVASLACWIPAWRAAKMDPWISLRRG